MKIVYRLLLLLCALNIADYLSTMLAVSNGAIEVNFLASYFINHNALHNFKLVGIGFICIYLIRAAKRDPKSRSRVIKLLYGANLAYGFIAASNLVVYLIQKRFISF